MKVPDEVVAAVRDARSVVIATHNPMDGDGLGCGLALQRALRAQAKSCTFVTEAYVPRAYGFLAGHADIVRIDGPPPPCDLLIGLDAGEAGRLGRAHAERPAGARVLNIDHHVSNTRYGDLDWVDPEAAATGEMVHGLLRALGWPLDAEIALGLLVAIVTDTGRFCYSSTTARTFEIAADLVRCGAEPDTIQRYLYASVPPDVLRLRAHAAERLRLHADGRVATLALPAGFDGAHEEDVKDLVDLVISVEGVIVAALLRGLPDGTTKVSLRSKDDRADVAALATRHGGGGHVRAAGFTAAGDPEKAERALRDDLVALAVAATG